MKAHLIHLTENPGKRKELRKLLEHNGIRVRYLERFIEGVVAPEETGTTLLANAEIKIRAYSQALAQHIIKTGEYAGIKFVLVCDDTGLEIPSLDGEPGITVRRWLGYRMSDDEIIGYTLGRLHGKRGKERRAQFRTVLAVGTIQVPKKSGPEHTLIGRVRGFEGTLKGRVLERPGTPRMEGFPMASLLYVPPWKMTLGACEQLATKKRERMLSHRERALMKALPYIKEELGIA